MSHPADEKSSLKGAWSGSGDPFYNFTPHVISPQQLQLETSDLYASWLPDVLAFWWLTVPQVGVVRITWHILEFCTPEISPERLQLESSNCVHELATWSISLWRPCPPSGWAWSGSRDSFLHSGALAISLERMKLDISHLVCRLNAKSTSISHVKVLQHGGCI